MSAEEQCVTVLSPAYLTSHDAVAKSSSVGSQVVCCLVVDIDGVASRSSSAVGARIASRTGITRLETTGVGVG